MYYEFWSMADEVLMLLGLKTSHEVRLELILVRDFLQTK